MNTRVIILPGLRTKNGQPDAELCLRCRGAARELTRHENAFIIACGGQTEPGFPSEASVMRRLLTEEGVPNHRIILEESSRITRENITGALAFAKGLTDRPLIVVTSDYHLRRVLLTVRRCGASAVGVPVKIPLTLQKIKSMLLEIPFTVDLLLGYQDEGAARPGWTRLIMKILRQERP